jgi:hypothetical protein
VQTPWLPPFFSRRPKRDCSPAFRRARAGRDRRNARHHRPTAKTHLEHIFLKTGATRQAELMRLWTELISPAKDEEDKNTCDLKKL